LVSFIAHAHINPFILITHNSPKEQVGLLTKSDPGLSGLKDIYLKLGDPEGFEQFFFSCYYHISQQLSSPKAITR
jgi:hypothetical protein